MFFFIDHSQVITVHVNAFSPPISCSVCKPNQSDLYLLNNPIMIDLFLIQLVSFVFLQDTNSAFLPT